MYHIDDIELLAVALHADNAEVFNYLVEGGADISAIDVLVALGHGKLACLPTLLAKLPMPPMHMIIDTIAICNENVVAFAATHFNISQTEWNRGLTIAENPTGFLPYANNYDKQLYERYGVVVISG